MNRAIGLHSGIRRNRLNRTAIAGFKARAEEASKRLEKEHRIWIKRVSTTTGNPSVIISENAPCIHTDHDNYVRKYLKTVRGVFGYGEHQTPVFKTTATVQKTRQAATVLYLNQFYADIPVFQGILTACYGPKGNLQSVAGNVFTDDEPPGSRTKILAQEAVMAAAAYIADPLSDEIEQEREFNGSFRFASVNLNGFKPVLKSKQSKSAEQACRFEPGPFQEEVGAKRIWFPAEDRLKPAWIVNLATRGYERTYQIVVDADSADILLCVNTGLSAAVRGRVYATDPRTPRTLVPFPRELACYGLSLPELLPEAFPDNWVWENETVDTDANNVRADLQPEGTLLEARSENDVHTFDPDETDTSGQLVLNLFYFVNYMHDFFYLLGFDETAGNFQFANFSRGGKGGDYMVAEAYLTEVGGLANITPAAEGTRTIMRYGPHPATGRHSALDATVVFHEYTHGVSTRLVGGVENVLTMIAPQSGGIGEGLSDFIACAASGLPAVGAWLADSPNGLRGYPFEGFPDSFGDLGSGRYIAGNVHNIGEIWCATLMRLMKLIGKDLTVRLVYDSMLLAPVNPGFLDMRDAMQSALQHHLDSTALNREQFLMAQYKIWEAFAQFGMGPLARSDGAMLTGIVADFDLHNFQHLAVNELYFTASIYDYDDRYLESRRNPGFFMDISEDEGSGCIRQGNASPGATHISNLPVDMDIVSELVPWTDLNSNGVVEFGELNWDGMGLHRAISLSDRRIYPLDNFAFRFISTGEPLKASNWASPVKHIDSERILGGISASLGGGPRSMDQAYVYWNEFKTVRGEENFIIIGINWNGDERDIIRDPRTSVRLIISQDGFPIITSIAGDIPLKAVVDTDIMFHDGFSYPPFLTGHQGGAGYMRQFHPETAIAYVILDKQQLEPLASHGGTLKGLVFYFEVWHSDLWTEPIYINAMGLSHLPPWSAIAPPYDFYLPPEIVSGG